MELPAMVIILLLIVGITGMPGAGGTALQHDNYLHTPTADPLSLAGHIIRKLEKTKSGPNYADWHLALASTKMVMDLINTAFTHEDGSFCKISEEIEDAFHNASISCKRVVRKVYAAAVEAETKVAALCALQESLQRQPNYDPELLQVVISTGLAMPTSIERDLEDVLSAYRRVITLSQGRTNAIAEEREQVSKKMCGGLAVGVLSGAAGLYCAVFPQVYSVALGAGMVSTVSFSKVRELLRSLAILEDRMKFLRKAKDKAHRQYCSVSKVPLLVQKLQSRIEGVTQVTVLDLQLQDGMRMFLSPGMTHRLQMQSQDLLKLQDECKLIYKAATVLKTFEHVLDP